VSTTLNSHPILALSLLIPRVGAWSADVECDTGEAIAGAVTLDLEGRIWRGAVVDGAVTYGRWSGRIVGGAGGLRGELAPVALANTTLRAVLEETLRAAGETIATTADTLTAAVARWHRLRTTGDVAVAEVARAAGMSWRVLRDGSVWMGTEAWGAVTVRDVDVLSREPITGCTELAGDAALDLAPGTTVTLDGVAVRIGAVTHRLDGAMLRTSVMDEREDVAGGRLMAAFETIVRRITRRLDFTGHYTATVVQQRASGRLDLRPEDPRRPSCTDVPYRTLPGLTVEIPAGSVVSFTYENGDPRRPVVVLWEPSTVATRWSVNGSTTKAARDGEAVNSTSTMATWITAVSALLNAPGAVIGAPSSVTPPAGAIGAVSGGSDVVRIP
jgi:hypothetical protein